MGIKKNSFEKLQKMKLLSILAISTSVLAQYNTCTDTARCDYQCSNAFFASESCSGNRADLACCTEAEACDLVDGGVDLACNDLPFLDNAGVARTYSCCEDSGDTDGDTSTGNSTTEATELTTATDDSDSSATKIGTSLLALALARLL